MAASDSSSSTVGAPAAAPGGGDQVAVAAAALAAVVTDAARTAKYTVRFPYMGREVVLLQTPRDRGADGEDNTGWCVWEAANVALRYLARPDGRDHLGLPPTVGRGSASDCGGGGGGGGGSGVPPLAGLRLTDLSCGAGLVALAAAAAGATVVATDVPTQLPQLRHNVEGASLSDRVACVPLYWGTPLDALAAAWAPSSDSGEDWFDLCIASDIAFIALRDGREAALRDTLVAVAAHCRYVGGGFLMVDSTHPPPHSHPRTHPTARRSAVLFVFEERLCREEQAFMESLGLGCDSSGGALLEVEELKGADVEVEADTALVGAGGHADTDLWNPNLFWEPPPIRMFILRRRAAAAAAAGR